MVQIEATINQPSESLEAPFVEETASESCVMILDGVDCQPSGKCWNSTQQTLLSSSLVGEEIDHACSSSSPFNHEQCLVNLDSENIVSSVHFIPVQAMENTQSNLVYDYKLNQPDYIIPDNLLVGELKNNELFFNTEYCDEGTHASKMLVTDLAHKQANESKDYYSMNYMANVKANSDVVMETIGTSRFRKDSTDSTDTVESSSLGEIFSSSYTDTVSSTSSGAFLLKPLDSDEEYTTNRTELKDVHTNEGYMTCSSTEVLNDDSITEESLLVYPFSTDNTLEQSKDNKEEIDDNSCESTGTCDNQHDHVQHSLIPIEENQVLAVFVDEVEPKSFTKITNNIIVVDESFLHVSQTNLGDLETDKQGKRAVTMQNLNEQSSFLDLTEVSKVGRACQKALIYLKDDMTLGSLASLNNMASKEFDKDQSHSISLISGKNKKLDIVASSKHTKNLIALSLCITLLFIAIGSVRNLQSSINHEGGVGVISMAISCVGFMIGSIFSTSIVQNFQPRTCIIVNLIPNLIYVAANIRPTMWLMVTTSAVQGISMAILWNTMSTYITFLARGRAQKKNEPIDQVSAKFFGIFCLIYQSYLIIGNLIASLVLMHGSHAHSILDPLNNTESPSNVSIHVTSLPVSTQASDAEHAPLHHMLSNQTLPVVESPLMLDNQSLKDMKYLCQCGGTFCQHFELGGSGFAVSDDTKYLLFGIYIGCIILSLFIAVFALEPLNRQLFASSVSPVQKLKSQMSSLTSFFIDHKFLLLLPLLIYSVMQFGFISAEFTKAFITCPLGIHMVGYNMICLGVTGSISSYLSGLLTKRCGRTFFLLFAGALNLGCLIYMTQWRPMPDDLVPYFVIMGVWGISDGIWISQVNSLMGVIFPDKCEEAFAGLRIAQGLGVAVAFGYSNSLCMMAKIYIMIAFCVVSLVGYLVMEALLKRKSKRAKTHLKQTAV